MKKILLAFTLMVLLLANASSASGINCCYRGPYIHGGPVGCCVGGWIAPAIVGGVIGYELARPPVYVAPTPVIVQPAPVIMQPAPVGYHYVMVQDPSCNCTKQALVPN